MTSLHSIVFEEIDQIGNHCMGTGRFHTIYLFHQTQPESPGYFSISPRTPFRADRDPTYLIPCNTSMRIVECSTDVPIVIERKGEPLAILMPNIHQMPTLTTCKTPDDQFPNITEKIGGFSKGSALRFREFL